MKLQNLLFLERILFFRSWKLAEAPDQKSGPKQGMICIVVTMAFLFYGSVAIFVIEAIQNVKTIQK
jgi:uncharacterized protein involved in exopolysaccharide biosynthesis